MERRPQGGPSWGNRGGRGLVLSMGEQLGRGQYEAFVGESNEKHTETHAIVWAPIRADTTVLPFTIEKSISSVRGGYVRLEGGDANHLASLVRSSRVCWCGECLDAGPGRRSDLTVRAASCVAFVQSSQSLLIYRPILAVWTCMCIVLSSCGARCG